MKVMGGDTGLTEQQIKERGSKLGVFSSGIGLGINASFTSKVASAFVMNGPAKYALFPLMIGFLAIQSVKEWMLVHKARVDAKEGKSSGLGEKIGQAILSTLISVALVTALVLLFMSVMTIAPFLLVGSFAFGTFLQGVAAVGATVDTVKSYREYKKGIATEYNKADYGNLSIEKQLDKLKKELKTANNEDDKLRIKTEHDRLREIYKKHHEPFNNKLKKTLREWMKFGIGVVGTIVFAMALIFAPGVTMPVLAGINVGASSLGLGIAIEETREQMNVQTDPQSVQAAVGSHPIEGGLSVNKDDGDLSHADMMNTAQGVPADNVSGDSQSASSEGTPSPVLLPEPVSVVSGDPLIKDVSLDMWVASRGGSKVIDVRAAKGPAFFTRASKAGADVDFIKSSIDAPEQIVAPAA
jgi:disulfide bond formation protein DsbB